MAKRMNRKPKKVVKIRSRKSFWNIGTIMFCMLFLYMAVYFIMCLRSPKVTAYEVTKGSLSGNYKYTALALKSETVVYSNESGKINYYAREKEKIGVGNGIYSIGKLKLSNLSDTEERELDEDDYSYLRSLAAGFTTNYSSVSYQDVYNFKAESQTAMLEILSKQAIAEMEDGSTAGLNLVKAETEGYVLYSVDGMEDLKPEDVTDDDFVRTNYKRESLRMKETVSAKDPVYKLITSEDWSLMIRLDRKTANELSDYKTVRFTFLEDNSTFNAAFSIIENNQKYYGKLDISNSVARFAADRYLDIELLVNKQDGLKIPNSSIVEKIFYKIPAEYAMVDEYNDDEIGLIKESYASDGSAVTKSIRATVYDKTDTDYYVDIGLFEPGDHVIMKDSRQKYMIAETKKLIGVYNINKGYAIFREITILDENEEYCIVKSNTDYGLAQYDHIVLDASSVKEDSIVVKGAN